MLRLLPRELREELWKFVHYIPTPEDYVLNRMNEREVMHYQDMVPIDTPPCLPLHVMAYNTDYDTDTRYLYYATDGMAVYVDYHDGSYGDFSCCAAMSTYRSKRMQDLYPHIHKLEQLLPDRALWTDIISA